MENFDVYGKTHRDGDAMIMVRNHNTCRALLKTSDHNYANYMRDRIEAELVRSRNKLEVVMHYYRLAYHRDIYVTQFI